MQIYVTVIVFLDSFFSFLFFYCIVTLKMEKLVKITA